MKQCRLIFIYYNNNILFVADRIIYFGGYGTVPDPATVDQSNGFFTFNIDIMEVNMVRAQDIFDWTY